MLRIGVVIPFFQRRPGILARALASVAAQDDPAVSVIVVDDGSPVPASDEGLPAGLDVRLLTRPNAGPAAARNTALEALDDSIAAVALLDSDDAWRPGHLAAARAALAAGADLYFCDHAPKDADPDGGGGSHFTRKGFDASRHPLIGQGPLRRFAGDFFDAQLRHYLAGTSTLVYRRARLADIRFEPACAFAGEDSIFILDLARRTDRVAFSPAVGVVYGEGVNIWSGVGLRDRAIFRRCADTLRGIAERRRRFPLTRGQEASLRAYEAVQAELLSEAAIWHARAGSLDLRQLGMALRTQPRMALAMARILAHRAGGAFHRRLGGRP